MFSDTTRETLTFVARSLKLFECLSGRVLFRHFLAVPLPASTALLFNFHRDLKCFLMIRSRFFDHGIHGQDMQVALTPFLQLTLIVPPEPREVILMQGFEMRVQDLQRKRPGRGQSAIHIHTAPITASNALAKRDALSLPLVRSSPRPRRSMSPSRKLRAASASAGRPTSRGPDL